jgi:hypothetical protein
VAARRREAEMAVQETRRAEKEARASLFVGLDRYGLPRDPHADLDPEALVIILTQRVQAGQVARRIKKLEALEAHEAEVAVRLDDLLEHLGFIDGDLETRLDRAIEAVAAARARQESPVRPRTREEVLQEVQELTTMVDELGRPTWTGPDPVAPPEHPDQLEDRRRHVAELIARSGRPDVVAAERAQQLADARVRDLAEQLADPALNQTIEQRLTARLQRTTRLGDHEETVPVIVDDALAGLPQDECVGLLDRIAELSSTTQVVLVSEDPIVDRWARERVGTGPITLYEAEQTAAVS